MAGVEPTNVASREELVAFIDALRLEHAERPTMWENADLSSFLKALAAWLEDSPGYFKNRGEPVPEQPSWMLVAMMLRAATRYE